MRFGRKTNMCLKCITRHSKNLENHSNKTQRKELKCSVRCLLAFLQPKKMEDVHTHPLSTHRYEMLSSFLTSWLANSFDFSKGMFAANSIKVYQTCKWYCENTHSYEHNNYLRFKETEKSILGCRCSIHIIRSWFYYNYHYQHLQFFSLVVWEIPLSHSSHYLKSITNT